MHLIQVDLISIFLIFLCILSITKQRKEEEKKDKNKKQKGGKRKWRKVGHPLGSPQAAHAHVHNRHPVPLLPRYADSSFLIAPYAVHQPISRSCIQALPHSNCAMLTVLFLQGWQAPYAVHQRIAGLCVLHKSLSNMKVHRYDIDFFFGCFKDMQQKLRMQILSNALPEILGV